MKTENIIAVISIIVTIILAYIGYTYYYPQDFSLSIEPMQGQVLQQGVLQTTATVSSANGYEKTVTLSSKHAIPEVVVSFIPSFGEANPAYKSNIMISVGKSVSAGTYEIEIKGQGSDGKTHSVSYTLNVMPGPTPTPTLTSTPIPTPILITNINNLGKQLFVDGKVSLQRDQYVLVFASGYGGYYVGELPANVSGGNFQSTMEMGEVPSSIKVIGIVVNSTSFNMIKGSTEYSYEYLTGLAIYNTNISNYMIK